VVLDLETHDAGDIVVAALRYPSTKASLVRAAAKIATKKDGAETSAEWKAKADETLDEISKHSNGSRNTLAHSLLEPREDGLVNVTNRTLSSRGQMTPGATEIWNLKDEIDEVRRLTKELREIRAELSKLEVIVGKIHWVEALFRDDPRRYLQPPYDQTQGPLGPLGSPVPQKVPR
jgi:hypothetical protein